MAAGDSLQQAQLNKLDALIARADINGSHHVLEIGCGWGSMAIRCVQRTGCRVRLAGSGSTETSCCTMFEKLHIACIMCRGLHQQHLTHCSKLQHCHREQRGSLCQRGGMEATSHDQTDSQPQRLLLLPSAVDQMGIECVVQVTGITLSKEQLAEAKLRVKQAGLDDRIELLYCDYR